MITKADFCLWIMRRMPKKVLYWAVIQAWSGASAAYPDKTPDEITWSMVCEYLEGSKIIQYTNLLHQVKDFKRKHAEDAMFQDRAKKLEDIFYLAQEIEE